MPTGSSAGLVTVLATRSARIRKPAPTIAAIGSRKRAKAVIASILMALTIAYRAVLEEGLVRVFKAYSTFCIL